MTRELTFDAVSEARAGPKWRRRWDRSWPAYEAWFRARGGDAGPDLTACVAALRRHMPELVPVHAALARLSGGGDREARSSHMAYNIVLADRTGAVASVELMPGGGMRRMQGGMRVSMIEPFLRCRSKNGC